MYYEYHKIRVISLLILTLSIFVYSETKKLSPESSELKSEKIIANFGIKLGPDLCHIYGSHKIESYTSKIRPSGSIYFEKMFNDYFSLQPEVMLISKAVNFKYSNVNGWTRQYYIEIPLLFKLLIPASDLRLLKKPPKIFIIIGPSYAFCPGRSDYDYDFVLHIGGGISFKAGPGEFTLEPRYALGFTENTFSDFTTRYPYLTTKFGVFIIMLGYGFNIIKH